MLSIESRFYKVLLGTWFFFLNVSPGECSDVHVATLVKLVGSKRVKMNALGDVVEVDVRNQLLEPRHIKAIMSCNNLEVLELNLSNVSDEDLRHVGQLQNLKVLRLGNTSVTDDGIAHLKDSENLVRIELSHTRISGTALSYLRTMKKLQYIELFSTDIADEGLRFVGDITTLRGLGFGDTERQSIDFKHLAKLHNLVSLHVCAARSVKPKRITVLSQLDNLGSLSLSHMAIDDQDAAAIARIKNLKRLNLSSTDVTDEGIRVIVRDIPKIEYLSLNNTAISDRAVAEIGKLSHLEKLFVGKCSVSDQGLEYLANVKSLKTLDLINTKVSDFAVQRYVELHPSVFIVR
jgi:Leucine-rich repeat (LRR) protein